MSGATARRPPVATYRVQLHGAFTLGDVEHVVPYLARLGVSHVYLSPIAAAVPGSTHGYDVTDPTRVADALGGEAGLASLGRALERHGMAALLDIVPNHMAASTAGAWWASLLEHGAASPHAATFDTPIADGAERLCIPVLGAPLADVLARGELTVAERAGRPVLRYHEHWFPVPAPLHAAARAAAGSHTRLRTLLDALPYELVHWRRAADVVCYRRFFDVATLVGVRVEDADVFARTHAGTLRWLAHGWIDALRIDHVDGLRDPAGYLRRLARATADARGGVRCWTLVEKILGPDEAVPADWPVDGTTGYEFGNLVGGWFVAPQGYRVLDALRRTATGEPRDFDTFVHDAQRAILDALFPAELDDVSARIADIAGAPLAETRTVVRELTAALPVYRTYIDSDGVRPDDRRVMEAAHARAARLLPDALRPTLDAVTAALLLDGRADGVPRDRALDAIARWQQLSGPAMAKGYEDTALYAWPALLALNDVGAEPEATLDTDGLHAALGDRARATPLALNAGSTHDAKRSEDVRARLLVLAEHASAWAGRFPAWQGQLDGIAARDAIVLLQTVVGVWPLEGGPDAALAERIRAFMRKAAREAKQETSWHAPDAAYEAALDGAVDYVLLAPGAATLRAELHGIVTRIALHGAANALSQLVLRCTAPGVPDVYQGNEAWRFDLVDPDNRRPVDFARLAARARQLHALVGRTAPDAVRGLLAHWRDGRIKQFVLMAALAARARNRAFAGDYTAVAIEGARSAHAGAFLRSHDGASALVVVTRWPAARAPDALLTGPFWQDTRLRLPRAGPVAWRCALTGVTVRAEGGAVRLAEALPVLPCALLEPA